MNIGGVLTFCIDRRKRTSSLRLFDINDSKLIFECEVYLNMMKHFKRIKANFYCFPLPNIVIGIEFVNNDDAEFFSLLIAKFCPKAQMLDDDGPIKRKHTLDTLKDELEANHLGEPSLSRPVSFKKGGIEWWNPLTQTFNLKEMPSEIKNLIKQIGYRKRDLLKPEKAKPIYDIIHKFGLDNIEAKVTEQKQDLDMSEIPRQVSEAPGAGFIPDFHGSRLQPTQSSSSLVGAVPLRNTLHVPDFKLGSSSHFGSIHDRAGLINHLNHYDSSMSVAPKGLANVPSGKSSQQRLIPPAPPSIAPLPPSVAGVSPIPPPPKTGGVPPPPPLILNGIPVAPPPPVAPPKLPDPPATGGAASNLASMTTLRKPGTSAEGLGASQPANVPAKPATLAEQLAMQRAKLREVEKEEVNKKVLNMSEHQQVQLKQNLAITRMQ